MLFGYWEYWNSQSRVCTYFLTTHHFPHFNNKIRSEWLFFPKVIVVKKKNNKKYTNPKSYFANDMFYVLCFLLYLCLYFFSFLFLAPRQKVAAQIFHYNMLRPQLKNQPLYPFLWSETPTIIQKKFKIKYDHPFHPLQSKYEVFCICIVVKNGFSKLIEKAEHLLHFFLSVHLKLPSPYPDIFMNFAP